MNGLRYARNRVHHQWADALVARDGADPPRHPPHGANHLGMALGRRAPTPPKGREDRRGKEAYATALAEHRADDALADMSHPFAFIGTLLDPPIAASNAPVVESIT